MIFVNNIKSAKAAKEYYSQHIAPGDYYTKDGVEMAGIWHGLGAERLGLSGEVKKEDIYALFENRNPTTGEQLTPRTKDDRRVTTDFTLDAPKGVTLAYELGGDEMILGAFRESVQETMGEIEQAAQTRVRKGGRDEDKKNGNLVWAENIHRTTRPVNGIPDPQLHAHAVIVNASWCDNENRWKAVQLGDVVRDKSFYQSAFHARLSGKLKDLGYGIEKQGNSFTLSGISRETVEVFSRRSAVIAAEAKRLGVEHEAAKAKLGRRTREKKAEKPATIAELREEWRSRATPEQLVEIETARFGWDRGDAGITPDQAKEYALAHSFQNSSAVSEKRLKAEALAYGVGSVLPQDVADIAEHPEVIAETRGGQLMTTTKTVLNNEIAYLQIAKDGQRKHKPFLAEVPGDALKGISTEQANAVLSIAKSREAVTGIIGQAGVGKTHTLKTVNSIIGDMQVVAPSATAVEGLKKDGFRNAITLEGYLVNEKAQQNAQGKPVLLDEAGLVSSVDMRRLFDLARRNGNRVILSGDYTQHSSVEAGDAFRLLEKEAGVKLARLTEIRRQTEPGYKKAVEQISQGTGKAAQRGFDSLDRMGSVIEASGEQRHQMLVKDYLNAMDEGNSEAL